MKNLLVLKITLFFMGAVLSAQVFAGGMSGGQGSNAFALQRIQAQHPMMTKEEVLVQAFKQAKGKPVQLHFQKMIYDRPTKEYSNREYAYILNSYKLSYYGSFVFGRFEVSGGEVGAPGIFILREAFNAGPIFANETAYTNYEAAIGESRPLIKGFFKIPSYNFNEGIKFEASRGRSFEIRQLDKDVVLIGYHMNANNQCEGYENEKPISGLCGVISLFIRN